MDFHAILLAAAVGGTVGVACGAVSGGVRRRRRQAYTKEEREKKEQFGASFFRLLTGSVYYVLGIALIWTIYYMVLGIVDRGLNEYAANSATLIVSVITVFSIIIAFHEFLHRKDDK